MSGNHGSFSFAERRALFRHALAQACKCHHHADDAQVRADLSIAILEAIGTGVVDPDALASQAIRETNDRRSAS